MQQGIMQPPAMVKNYISKYYSNYWMRPYANEDPIAQNDKRCIGPHCLRLLLLKVEFLKKNTFFFKSQAKQLTTSR